MDICSNGKADGVHRGVCLRLWTCTLQKFVVLKTNLIKIKVMRLTIREPEQSSMVSWGVCDTNIEGLVDVDQIGITPTHRASK